MFTILLIWSIKQHNFVQWIQTIEEIAEEAVEALLNNVVHRDYSFSGEAIWSMSMRTNRICFSRRTLYQVWSWNQFFLVFHNREILAAVFYRMNWLRVMVLESEKLSVPIKHVHFSQSLKPQKGVFRLHFRIEMKSKKLRYKKWSMRITI